MMRIRIIQAPTSASIDGLRLDGFKPGRQYEVDTTLATYLFAEGWAEWVGSDETASSTSERPLEPDIDRSRRPTLRREIYPPDRDRPPALADGHGRRPHGNHA
jgi:hypothetical protein